MSEFVAGLGSLHAAASVLRTAFAEPVASGFEVRDLSGRTTPRPRSFEPAEQSGPRHFSPADRDANPTEGWDPFDPEASTPEAGGFVDPIAAAREAGHAEGYAAAMAQAAAEAGRDRAFGDALGEALSGAARFDREAVADRLRRTVLALTTRLVGEVGVSGERLAGRIGAAVDLLADAAESALLRLNPQDVPLVEGKLPRTLFPVGDAAIARGSFVLESASTIVEDGPEQWLEQLAQAIDRVAVPPA